MRKKYSILLFALFTTNIAHAQLTGIDLYNTMNKPTFIQYQGQSGLPWLPGDMGYLNIRQEDDGIEFYKVNPETNKETRLFNNSTKNSIIDQYNMLMDTVISNYPFVDFDFVMEDKALFLR